MAKVAAAPQTAPQDQQAVMPPGAEARGAAQPCSDRNVWGEDGREEAEEGRKVEEKLHLIFWKTHLAQVPKYRLWGRGKGDAYPQGLGVQPHTADTSPILRTHPDFPSFKKGMMTRLGGGGVESEILAFQIPKRKKRGRKKRKKKRPSPKHQNREGK